MSKKKKDEIKNENVEEIPNEENLEELKLTKEELLEKELEEEKDKYLRLLAEYDNFRKRTVKEKSDMYKEGILKGANNLLPTLDNLERALQNTENLEGLISGVEMIQTGVIEAFKALGIEEIETKEFDPNFHNAVMHIDDENYGKNEIVEVFQKGYKLSDKVLRTAMVKVAN